MSSRRPTRQLIPVPPGAEAGGPAPWAALPVESRRGITLARVRDAIRERSGPAVAWPGGGEGRPSAVLAALFEEDGEARVILTRRAEHLRNHRGEVSFPGGRLEPDESPVAGALREAAEEIGLDPSTVEIVGELAPLSTMSSTAGITPFVGVLARRPELTPNPAEVDHIFDVALADLLADDVFEEEVWTTPDRGRRSVYFFHLEEDTVWGATARVLLELLELVALGGRRP